MLAVLVLLNVVLFARKRYFQSQLNGRRVSTLLFLALTQRRRRPILARCSPRSTAIYIIMADIALVYTALAYTVMAHSYGRAAVLAARPYV